MTRTIMLAVVLGILGACAGVESDPGQDTYRRDVTASSPEAKQLFDEGLLLIQGFNHDEAVRRFDAAIAIEADFAMAHWGVAFSLGPNINLPLTEEAVERRARAAADQAMAARENCSPVERALIEALDQRYARAFPADREALDRAYANAMRRVWRRFPEDPDVGSLCADAILNLDPWSQWTKTGQPRANTREIVAILERTMSQHPRHPLANHLYIHAVEASKTPERAVPAAERLAELVPDSGHLVHMPAHIWVNVGRYSDARIANERAVVIDNAYFERAGPQGIYEFYRAHNYHFLTYAAMFEGRKETSLAASRELVARIPEVVYEQMPQFVDGFLAVPFQVQMRFGLWEEILEAEAFPERFPIANAMRHHARGVALANLDRHDEAETEAAAFEAWVARVGKDATFGINPAAPVIVVARHMLEGERLFRRGDHERGLVELRLAVIAEDALRYDEPSPWMQPVRHALGALLLERGLVAGAESVYRADLDRHPENGWALHGLAECLEARGALEEAALVQARFQAAWRSADIELEASCFCRRATLMELEVTPCCED